MYSTKSMYVHGVAKIGEQLGHTTAARLSLVGSAGLTAQQLLVLESHAPPADPIPAVDDVNVVELGHRTLLATRVPPGAKVRLYALSPAGDGRSRRERHSPIFSAAFRNEFRKLLNPSPLLARGLAGLLCGSAQHSYDAIRSQCGALATIVTKRAQDCKRRGSSENG